MWCISDKNIPLIGKKRYFLDDETGWTISGSDDSGSGEWVECFEASHPGYGQVWGNFGNLVFADSEKAFKHFLKNHPPEEWENYYC